MSSSLTEAARNNDIKPCGFISRASVQADSFCPNSGWDRNLAARSGGHFLSFPQTPHHQAQNPGWGGWWGVCVWGAATSADRPVISPALPPLCPRGLGDSHEDAHRTHVCNHGNASTSRSSEPVPMWPYMAKALAAPRQLVLVRCGVKNTGCVSRAPPPPAVF